MNVFSRWPHDAYPLKKNLGSSYAAIALSACCAECLIDCLFPIFVLPLCQPSSSFKNHSAFSAPPKHLVSVTVITFNILGSYLEGRAAGDAESRTGFSSGFLSVLTSFPDVGDSASDIAASTTSYHLGATYCLASMLISACAYTIGRRHSNSYGTFVADPDKWQRQCIAVVGVTVAVVILYRSNVCTPVDFSRPDVAPPFRNAVVGLVIACGMSVGGAMLGTIVTDSFHPGHELWARLVNNVASCVFVIWARMRAENIRYLGFFTLKFMTAFCGALSNYSGTIRDVMEEYNKHNRGRGASNFMFHLVLCVALMIVALHLMTAEVEPILLSSTGRRRWVREVHNLVDFV